MFLIFGLGYQWQAQFELQQMKFVQEMTSQIDQTDGMVNNLPPDLNYTKNTIQTERRGRLSAKTLFSTLFLISWIAPSARAQVSLASTSFVANVPFVDFLTSADIILSKDAFSAPWADRQCMEVKIGNPYADASLYQSFSPDNPVDCTTNDSRFDTTCTYFDSETVHFYFTFNDSEGTTLNILEFNLNNFRNPWSAQKLQNIVFRVYQGETCSGAEDSIANAPAIRARQLTTPERNFELSSTTNTLSNVDPQNALMVKVQPETGFSRSGKGTLKLITPTWYSQDNVIMFNLDSDDESMCESEHMTVDIVVIDRINRMLTIFYENMEADVIRGEKPLVFKCFNFRNPIFQKEWRGFTLTSFDDEVQPNTQMIETSQQFSLDAWNYTAVTFPDKNLQILPKIAVINELSTWTFTLSLPTPLDTGCWIKFYLPSDLEFRAEKIVGRQLFRPSISSDIINLDELVINQNDVDGQRSIVIPACLLPEWVGFSPQGTLTVDKISTPMSIKDTEKFRVEIYKDANLNFLISKIATGRFISFTQLKPGEITNIGFAPRDTKVQAIGPIDITFEGEHQLTENGVIIITFPKSMVLPEPGKKVSIAPNLEELWFSATEGEVLLGNQIRITNIFNEGAVPEFPYTFQFNIDGIQNQRAANAAGPVNITTYLQDGDETFSMVNTGVLEDTFEATTTQIEFLQDVSVSNPVTLGSDSIFTLEIIPEASIPVDGFLYIQVPPSLRMIPNQVKSEGSCRSKVQCLEVIENIFFDDPSSPGQIKIMVKDKEIPAGEKFIFELGGVRNPRSTESTGNFVVNSFDTDDLSQIGKGQGPNVQMTELADLGSFSGTASSTVNGEVNTYTFSLLSDIIIQQGDVLQYDLPKQIRPPGSSILLNCQPTEGVISVTCSVSGQTIQIIFDQLQQNSTNNFKWTIDNIKNPTTMSESDPFDNIILKDQANFNVAKLFEVSNTITNDQAGIISTANLQQDAFKASEPANYVITFNPTNSIPSSGAIQITWPPRIQIPEDAGCVITTTEEFSGKGFCDFNFDPNYVIITGVFDGADSGYNGQIAVELENIINPPDNRRDSSGFSIRTYSDTSATFLIDKTVQDLWPTLECDYPCQTCIGSEIPSERSQCTSCWTYQNSIMKYFMPSFDTDGEYLGFGICKADGCDDGFTRDNSTTYVCERCALYCDTCDDTNREYCLTCPPKFPFQVENTGICLEACKNGYYQSSTQSCSSCVSPCENCVSTANTCTACMEFSGTPLLDQQTNTCLSECPFDFTPINRICTKCMSPCLTCEGTPNVCQSCNGADGLIYLDGNICKPFCEDGQVVNATDDKNLKCVACQVAQCKICDINFLDQCLECLPGYYVYDGQCVSECPTDFRVGNEAKACVLITINDLGIFYFPFLMIAFILCLIVIFGTCKKTVSKDDRAKKKTGQQKTITALLVVIAFVLFFALIAQAVWAFLFGTLKYFFASAGVVILIILFNFVFVCAYRTAFIRTSIPASKRNNKSISRKKLEEFREPADAMHTRYRYQHKCVAYSIVCFSCLCTFKCNKLLYSHLYSFGAFKARWTKGKYYRKFMTTFCMINMIIEALIVCIAIAGLYTLDFMSNMLFITMVETGVLAIISIILGLFELFKMKDYLLYNEGGTKKIGGIEWGSTKSRRNLAVRSGFDDLDKDSRLTHLKGLLGNVKSKQGVLLNNRLDELLDQFGDRRCKSCVEFGTGWPKVDDPRRCVSWPLNRDLIDDYDADFKFTKDDFIGSYDDNVYADVKQKPEAHTIAVQGDQGQQDFMRQLHRKQGDLLAAQDSDDEYDNRKKTGKRRGRKNKYYTAIDAEDDEEAEGQDPSVDEDEDVDDNLEMLKEQEEEERRLRQKVEEEKLKQQKAQAERRAALQEAERLRLEAEAEEEEERKKAEYEQEQLRLVQEREELARLAQIEQSRQNLQLEEEEERKLREDEERRHQEELKKLSEQNRIKYEEEEAKRLTAQAQEDERLRLEGLQKEKKLQEELEAQRKLAQEEKERKQAEKDAEQLRLKQEALQAEELSKQQAKESERKEQDEIDTQRRLRAQQAADEKRQQKDKADRLKKEDDERRRQELLAKDDAERQARIRKEDQDRAKRNKEEEEFKARIEEEERKRREALAKEERERLDKIEKETAERMKRLQKEEEEHARLLQQEENKRLVRAKEIEEETKKLKAANMVAEEERLKKECEEEERILKEKAELEEQKRQLEAAMASADQNAKAAKEKELREMEEKIERERLEREKLEKQNAELARKQKEAEDKLAAEKEEIERQGILKEAEELERQETLKREREAFEAERLRQEEERKLQQQQLADERQRQLEEQQRIEDERKRHEEERRQHEEEQRRQAKLKAEKASQISEVTSYKNRPNTTSDIGHIVEQKDGESEVNNTVIMQDQMLKDFGKDNMAPVQIPPNEDMRTFNVNDILGDLDMNPKGNIIVLNDDQGNNFDKEGRPTNIRGYLTDSNTGDIIENFTNKKMFDAAEIDEKGEIPAPYCVEKFNFNPHDLLGDLDYDFDKKSNTIIPKLLKTKQGYFVDKRNRRINKFGWLIQGPNGHLVDKHGRKKFDRKQTEDGDIPKLLNYSGKRFDIKDVVGVFDKDQNGFIMPLRSQDGSHLNDNLGRRVNENGYLVDVDSNVIDKDGKRIFQGKHLKNGEFPKIFLFTKFNINNVTGDFEMSPLTDPILDKDAQGNLIDRKGRRVNQRGYLIDQEGNIIDKRGRKMFDKVILSNDGEIPKIFRMGMLKSDSGSSLSRLMEEIEKNNPSEFGDGNEEEKNDEVGDMEDGNGDTSMDSMMEDTPANYNMANQRFDDQEDYEAIPEEPEGNSRQKQKRKRVVNKEDPQIHADQELPKRKTKKKRKKTKKEKMLEYLMPTQREVSMADAYGGQAKGQFRRQGVKYDKERLQNRIKTPANIPGGRAQLEALASTVAGFNKNPDKSFFAEESVSARGTASRPPRTKKNRFVGGQSEAYSNDGGLDNSVQNRSQQINDLREKKGRRKDDGDFEQMFGKDIDKYLEESDWGIDSNENMSHYSKGDSNNPDHKLRGMEKAYLQRQENNVTQGDKHSQQARSVGPKRRKDQSNKKPPAFREFQDRFVDDPDYIQKGQKLEFEVGNKTSSQKKKVGMNTQFRDGPAGANSLNSGPKINKFA